ncbi:MAG: ABC transporter ATP-binding protein [Bacteriovoracaceae bacterium]|nr:ABC transporter ATP-binding protein [Bacteriovoracaceae bacterium]
MTTITTNSQFAIELKNIVKTYEKSQTESLEVLKGISLKIPHGQFTSLMGPSGSGKSTLLQVMGALDVPTNGEVIVNGSPIHKMDDQSLTLFRRRHLGFIFQFFNLLPTLTAQENVALPALLDGKSFHELKNKVKDLLSQLGLGDRLNHFPHQLSGGEMQRVAIARSLINQPLVILADEPTGNLDSKTGNEVLAMFRKLTKENNVTVVMVTHDLNAANVGDKILRLRDGLIDAETLASSSLTTPNKNILQTPQSH